MLVVTLIIEFEDGRSAAFIGPADQIPAEFEVTTVGISEPTEMPDCKLSDISSMKYQDFTQH